MGINYDDDELDKTPTHLLRFCLLGFIPTTMMMMIIMMMIMIMMMMMMMMMMMITR